MKTDHSDLSFLNSFKIDALQHSNISPHNEAITAQKNPIYHVRFDVFSFSPIHRSLLNPQIGTARGGLPLNQGISRTLSYLSGSPSKYPVGVKAKKKFCINQIVRYNNQDLKSMAIQLISQDYNTKKQYQLISLHLNRQINFQNPCYEVNYKITNTQTNTKAGFQPEQIHFSRSYSPTSLLLLILSKSFILFPAPQLIAIPRRYRFS